MLIKRRNFILAFVAVVALSVGGGFIGGRSARATYQVTLSDPGWSFLPGEIEKQVANFAKTNGITTQTGWDTFVNGLTAGQSIAVSQGLLRAVKCSVP